MSRITDYTALGAIAAADLLPVVDVSDTTMAATGTTKKTTPANLGVRRPATLVVAASNASAAWLAAADSVCAGSGDQATINAAMAALPAWGGTVLLSDGTFGTTAALVPTVNNTRLLGQGPEATTIRAAAGSTANGYQYDRTLQAYNLIFCAIEGLTLDGASNAAGHGCYINYTNATNTFWDFLLRDVWFKNWGGDGFRSTCGHGYVLDHVLAEYCGGNGITFTGGFTDSPPRIVNGTAKLNTGAGISAACTDVYVGHNEISNNGGGGLIMSASGCHAAGNQVRSNTGPGVRVTGGAEGITVTGNTISSNTQHGILLDDANCAVAANFLTGNGTAAAGTYDEISIAHGTFAASGNQITGNAIDCASVSRYGINFGDAAATAGVAVANRIIAPVTAKTASAPADTVILGADNQTLTAAGGMTRLGSCLGWTMPPHWAEASVQPAPSAAGVLIMFAVEVPAPGTTAGINWFIVTAGNTLANVYCALVNPAGTLVASTANRAADAALTGTAVLWSPPWTAGQAIPAGQYWAALLIGSATTMPTFASGTSRLAAMTNVGCTPAAGNLRSAFYSSGLAALPASVTVASMSSYANTLWAALT